MLLRAAGIEHSVRPLGEWGTEGDRKEPGEELEEQGGSWTM